MQCFFLKAKDNFRESGIKVQVVQGSMTVWSPGF